MSNSMKSRFSPAGLCTARPIFTAREKFLTVQKGQIRVESDDDAETLNPGDSATYRADVPHAIVNAGRTEAVVFLVDICN